MFLGLLNLLLLRGNSLNVDNSTEEFLADGTTSIPFEHFHRIGHSIAPENAFDFHVNCAGMIPSDCSKAKQVLKRAGIRIASSLLFRNQVQVEVSFPKFDSRRTSSVRAIPNYSYAGRIDNGQLLKYPSAAIKQRADTSPGPTIPDLEIDMSLEFDLIEDWFFDFGRREPSSDDSVDFEYAALHAITHGLGFDSTLKYYKHPEGDFLAPEIIQTKYGSECYFSPISAFDSLMYGTRLETKFFLGELVATISTAPKMICDSSESYLKAFQSSPFVQIAENLLRLVHNNYLSIRPLYRDPFTIVFAPTNLDTAHVHLHPNRSPGAEFLMTELRRGVTLSQKLKELGTSSIYGQNTLKIMEGLGYATHLNPLFRRMELSTSFGTKDYNPDDSRWISNTNFY